jgi:hypothetical protein
MFRQRAASAAVLAHHISGKGVTGIEVVEAGGSMPLKRLNVASSTLSGSYAHSVAVRVSRLWIGRNSGVSNQTRAGIWSSPFTGQEAFIHQAGGAKPRANARAHVAFCCRGGIGTPDYFAFAAHNLACTHPCPRCASDFEAPMHDSGPMWDATPFAAMDFHPQPPAGLPAHRGITAMPDNRHDSRTAEFLRPSPISTTPPRRYQSAVTH